MATKLKNLVITKVALVDEGSCSAAHIKLYKRKQGGNQSMNEEELLKLIPEDQREAAKAFLAKAKKDAADQAAADMEDAMDGGIDDALENPDGTPKKDTKKKSVAKVATKIKELTGEIAKLKAPGAPSEEEILKNLDPAVRAIIEKSNAKAKAAETAILKMKDEADTAEALAKAKELPNIGAKTEDLAKSFKTLKNLNGDVFEEVYGIMKAANELIEKGGALGELGANGNQDDETIAKAADAAWAEIEKKAEDIKKSANCSKEQAITRAIKENDGLYKKYLDNLK